MMGKLKVFFWGPMFFFLRKGVYAHKYVCYWMILKSNGNVLHVRPTDTTYSITVLPAEVISGWNKMSFLVIDLFSFVGTSDACMFAFCLVKVTFWSLVEVFVFCKHQKLSVILYFYILCELFLERKHVNEWHWHFLKKKSDIFLSGTLIFFI